LAPGVGARSWSQEGEPGGEDRRDNQELKNGVRVRNLSQMLATGEGAKSSSQDWAQEFESE